MFAQHRGRLWQAAIVKCHDVESLWSDRANRNPFAVLAVGVRTVHTFWNIGQTTSHDKMGSTVTCEQQDYAQPQPQ